MVNIKKRTKFIREPKKKYIEDKFGVIISINTKGYQDGQEWLDELLVKGEKIYDTWSIKSAFKGMEIWIAESGVGLTCYARIGNINYKSNPFEIKLIDAEKIDEPITVDELRDLKIIKKNTPQTLQYLTKEQCEKLNDLFK